VVTGFLWLCFAPMSFGVALRFDRSCDTTNRVGRLSDRSRQQPTSRTHRVSFLLATVSPGQDEQVRRKNAARKTGPLVTGCALGCRSRAQGIGKVFAIVTGISWCREKSTTDGLLDTLSSKSAKIRPLKKKAITSSGAGRPSRQRGRGRDGLALRVLQDCSRRAGKAGRERS